MRGVPRQPYTHARPEGHVAALLGLSVLVCLIGVRASPAATSMAGHRHTSHTCTAHLSHLPHTRHAGVEVELTGLVEVAHRCDPDTGRPVWRLVSAHCCVCVGLARVWTSAGDRHIRHATRAAHPTAPPPLRMQPANQPASQPPQAHLATGRREK